MNNISFTTEQTEQLKTLLQQYFERELDQDLGDFDADFLLDFVKDKLGVHFYNQGLRDAQAVLMSKVDDITEAIEEIEQVTDF